MQDSFKREFDTLRELGNSTFVLRGSTLIVEVMDAEEIKTKSGIIVGFAPDHVKGGSVQAHKVEIGRVLMAGQGYWEEYESANYAEDRAGVSTGEYEPLECQPGAIVVLPQYSLQLMSHFPGVYRPTGNKLAMVKMDQVLAYYPSEEAYEIAKEKLNA